jgi:4-hydroxybenzoate polyprenyltransferase
VFSRLIALLATARIANVPSVMINVLTGMFLLGFLFDTDSPYWNQQTIFPIIAACCLYVAGNFLNDWYDVAWDREHRPERAIPSGLFPRGLYLSIAVILVLAGATISWCVSKTVFFTYNIILCFVIAYTLLHKRHAFSIWIMGACRAGLYVLGLGAMSAGFRVLRDLLTSWQDWHGVAIAAMILVPALGMLTYIAGISLLARYESRPADLTSAKWIAALLLLFPLCTHLAPWVGVNYLGLRLSDTWVGAFGILPFLGWTLFVVFSKAAVGQKVARLLAGIALVDSLYWLSMGWSLYAMLGYHAFLWFSLLPLLAFVLALILQKIAPAT